MKKKTKQLVLILICTGLVFGSLCLFYFHGHTSDKLSTGMPAAESADDQSPEPLSISELIDSVKSVKNTLMSALDDIKGNKLDSAKEKLQSISRLTRAIRVSIDHTVNFFHGSVPLVQKQIDTILELLDTGDLAIEKIALPAIDLLQEHPISQMRVDDGINTRQLCVYLDFAESIMPDVERLAACVNSIDFSIIDSDGKIAGYLDTANSLLEIYHADDAIISKVKSMLGAESDRLYLIAAQNSSEIRASGGFPGSVGVIRIQDGVLTLGDFRAVYDMLSTYSPSYVRVTKQDYKLFGYMSGMHAPRDACLCPDFERVAYIWAAGYEAKNHEAIDGVVSMTPHMVQRLLNATNQEITLSDGSLLTGENATHVLQYDLYFKYFSKDYTANGGAISDELFAEAAKETMKVLTDNLALSHLLQYISVAKESFEDRTLMLWMRDETEQALLAELGWNGGLNTDPQKPQAGVYYNCTVASKLGWFLLLDTQLGDRYPNEDGSYSYPVTVTFSNTMTQEELAVARPYILGVSRGTIQGAAYFFAPAGGSVKDFKADKKISIQNETYEDHQLGFIRLFQIKPGETVTVTYTVTTAPGIDTPLAISQTPTAQQ